MKRIASVLLLTLAASAAWAQASGNPMNVVSGVRSNLNQATSQSATGTGVKTGGGMTAASGSKNGFVEPVQSFQGSLGDAARQVAKAPAKPTTPPKPSAKAVAKKAAKPAAAPATAANAAPVEEKSVSGSKLSGKRDPFVSPIISKVTGPVGCSGGKKCLVIDQVALKGVVKSPNGMIAVIENSAKKAYFMRENDPVYNGFVVKITPDSIVFRETVTDRIGRQSTRDIVKRVTAPSV